MRVRIPAKRGAEAFEELDRVPWDELDHAYGRGPIEGFDVAASLRELAEDDDETRQDAAQALFSMICHQGTTYSASPHAVPFLAAFAAGDDVDPETAKLAVFLMAQIGASSTFVAPHLSHAGAASAEVAREIREAFVASRSHLEALVLELPAAGKLASALLTLREAPDEWARINALVQELAD